MSGRHWTERLARRVTPDLAICNSHFTRRSLDTLYPASRRSSCTRRSNCLGLSTTPFVFAFAHRSRRKPDSVVIVQACRSEEWKGHEQLLDALVALRGVPGWIWWQVGGAQRPHERAFLARLRDKAARAGIGDRIRWLGERSDVGQLLAAADVYCQPNLEPEPFGIVFIEALGRGAAGRDDAAGGGGGDCRRDVRRPRPAAAAGRAADTLRELVTDSRAAIDLRPMPGRAARLCDPGDADAAIVHER